MRKIHLALASNSLAFLFIGLFFDKIIAFFGVSSIISYGIIIVALILALIPTLFVAEIYEVKSESFEEWTRKKGLWGLGGTEKGKNKIYHSDIYRVVKLFGIIPIKEPEPIESKTSYQLDSTLDPDYDKIQTFVDFIASIIPILNGWLIKSR
jgi:hypothetical protein